MNERIRELNGRLDDLDLRTIICECSREDCMTPIGIAPEAPAE